MLALTALRSLLALFSGVRGSLSFGVVLRVLAVGPLCRIVERCFSSLIFDFLWLELSCTEIQLSGSLTAARIPGGEMRGSHAHSI